MLRLSVSRAAVAASRLAAMAQKIAGQGYDSPYRLRKQTVEPVFGIIKHVMKFRQFMVRGLTQVSHEWNLVAIAWNLKRMMAMKMA